MLGAMLYMQYTVHKMQQRQGAVQLMPAEDNCGGYIEYQSSDIHSGTTDS